MSLRIGLSWRKEDGVAWRSRIQRKGIRREKPPGRRLSFEGLEDRDLLSGVVPGGEMAVPPMASANDAALIAGAPGDRVTGVQRQTLADLPVSAQYAISASIGRDQSAYHAAANPQGLVLSNVANGFTAQLQSGVLHVSSGAETFDMSLEAFGRGSAVQQVWITGRSSSDNRVECDFGPIDAWYVNGPGGLQQGFTIAQPPAPDGEPLVVDLGLRGDLTATINAGRDGLTLTRPDGSIALNYGGLSAWDATGRVLPAWMDLGSEGGSQRLWIRVDDTGAQGAITIDPLFQQAKLTASDGAAENGFGYSVAISGDTIVVGAPGNWGYDDPSAAYVFVAPSSGWSDTQETAKLMPFGGAKGIGFGYSVAISGDTIVVTGWHTAYAYVFVKPSTGWSGDMHETAKLTPSDGSIWESVWMQVAISGNTVVAGAPYLDIGGNADQGAAYVFVEPDGGWSGDVTETAKLRASDSAARQHLGSAVAVSGDTVVVGTTGWSTGTSDYGAVYVFVKPAAGWHGDITQTAKLTASDGTAGDWFGAAAAIDRDTVVVGAMRKLIAGNNSQGAAYVFVKPESGWSGEISETARLRASDGVSLDEFGNSVGISGDTVVVGAFSADNLQGKVYQFVRPNSGWSGLMHETAALTVARDLTSNRLGSSVGISGNTIIAGAPTYMSAFVEGAAYVLACGVTLTPRALPAGLVDEPYNQTIVANHGTGTVTLTVSNLEGAISGLTVPASGSGALAISGTPTATGTATFTVTAVDSAGNTTSADYRIAIESLLLSPATLPMHTANLPYSQTITALGGIGDVTLLVSDIRGTVPGLIVPSRGTRSVAIAGTPTAGGTVSFTVTAFDSAGNTSSTRYNLRVNEPITFTPAVLRGNTVNNDYYQMVAARGGTGPVTMAVSDVQGSIPGLNVPSAAARYLLISGKSAATGTESFTVTATDYLGSTTTKTYSIVVNPPLIVTPDALPEGTAGLPYSATIDTSGGTAPVSIFITYTPDIPGLNVPTFATGSLTISGTPTAPGTETLNVFVNDSGGAYRSITYTVTINSVTQATSTVVTASPNPATLGDAVTFTATVGSNVPGADVPTGTVTFEDRGVVLGAGTLDGDGAATFTTTALSVGSHTITASYEGDADFAASSGTVTETIRPVGPIATMTVVTAFPAASARGAPVTFTARVGVDLPGSGTPTGAMVFKEENRVLGISSLDASGAAVFTTSKLSLGTHTITASYAGDDRFLASHGSAAVTIRRAVTTSTHIVASTNPAALGQSVTLTATVRAGRGVPTGQVLFKDGKTVLATVPLDAYGSASFANSDLKPGRHGITAAYQGDSTFAASARGLMLRVAKGQTTTTLLVSPDRSVRGQTVTVLASVAATVAVPYTPTGKVVFRDGAKILATFNLDANGEASLTVSTLSIGKHRITASYLGDGNFRASTSATVLEIVTSTETSSTPPAPDGKARGLASRVEKQIGYFSREKWPTVR